MLSLRWFAARVLSVLLLWVSVAVAVVPPAPQLDAAVHLLVDVHSQRVLSEQDAEQRVEPASLTKLMTEFVVFSELDQGRVRLDDEVVVSALARSMGGSRMFLEAGSVVTVEELLQGVIIQSGNDASVALAEHVAGSVEGFAVLMNRYAAELGMVGSNFVNAHGLPDPEHYSTARDMARLASALIQRFPHHYRWHSSREFTHNGITQRNRNRLLWLDESVDGMKTGYTSLAGYCLVASAERAGMRLVSVVMGAQSAPERVRQSQALLEYGFRNYETYRLYGSGEAISRMRVWQGAEEAALLGLSEPLVITVPRGEYPNLKAGVVVDERVLAPVAEGERHGTLRVSLGETVVAERDLVALSSVDLGGLWRRLSDRARLLLE